MIQTINKTFKTFTSFTLALCMLSLRASCFFARAEKLFGSEVSGMLGSAKLQTVSELLFVISSACLLLLSLLWVFILLLVRAGAAALGVARFCAWTDAEIAFFSASGLLRSFDGPFRRFPVGFFVLLIENSLRFLMTVKDGSETIIQGLWEAGCLKVLVVAAAVVQATTSHYYSESKRDRRVVFRVSFVSILLMVLSGVVGSLGGVSWLGFGAIGLLLLVEELRRSSAATKATLPARLGLLELEASSCPSFASSRRLGARSVKVNDWFEMKSVHSGTTGAPVYRKLFCNVWCVTLFAVALLIHSCFSSEMLEGCVHVWMYLQSRSFLGPLELLMLMILVFVFIALVVATAYALFRAAVSEVSFLCVAMQSLGRVCKGKFLAAFGKNEIAGGSVPESDLPLPRVQFLSDESLLFSYQFVKLRAEMSAKEFLERYDGRYVSRDFMVNKRQEVAWERIFEVFASDDFFDPDWYHLLHDLVPVFTDETFFVDEKGEKCHPAHWTAFSADVVPFLKELGVVPPGFASWDAYESYLHSYHEFYQVCIKWYDHHFCGMAVEPLILEDVGEDCDFSTDNQPDNSMDLELESHGSTVDAEEVGCMESGGGEHTDEGLLSVNYLPVIEEEGEEVAEMEEEECSYSAPAEDARDSVGKVDEEEEPEVEVEPQAAVALHRPARKLKPFGPCHRTRPYLKRKCKENVRYTK